MEHFFSKLRALLVVLGLFVLSSQSAACVVILADDDDEEEDFPEFLVVDAGCDDEDWWILTASVSHVAGASAIVAVWVEVYLVDYDDYEVRYYDDYQGSIQLDLLGDTDWRTDLHQIDTFLDCYYPGEYLFRFVAEDIDGDLASIDLIN